MKTREDSFLHKGWRRQMINELRGQLNEINIVDEKVLETIFDIPRHYFLDPALAHKAYEIKAFKILANQTISNPFTVAVQTHLLNLQPNDIVLEIGTGSAYQAAVLAKLNAQVYTIERQKELYENNIHFFPYKDIFDNLHFFEGDGFEGLPQIAPFDKILITCGAPIIPPKLIAQLKIGGQMVIPLGEGKTQIMKRITKINSNEATVENFGEFSFVPMLEGTAEKRQIIEGRNMHDL
jgi:protein-L-isoaspartate(D-aspartate) O-methyltransferase